jgi:hypothetical protein
MQEIKSSERRTRLLLWVLAAAVVLVYGTLALAVLQSRQPPASNEEEAFTAKTAYTRAEAVAKGWQEDARLVSARAAWGNATESGFREGKTSWAFYFLSPQARQIRIFSVTAEEAVGTRTMDALSISDGIDLTLWQVDSPQAIQLFLDEGGQAFLDQHPDAGVNLQLILDEQNRQVWMASGFSGSDQASLTVILDAQTGEVVGQ